MVILKWLNSLLVGRRSELQQVSAGKSAEEYKKNEKKKSASSVDVINAALVDRAEDFDDLVTAGSPLIKRKKLKRKIRRRVEKAMCAELSDPEIIDEVTERIATAAEIDPYYEKLFCKE